MEGLHSEWSPEARDGEQSQLCSVASLRTWLVCTLRASRSRVIIIITSALTRVSQYEHWLFGAVWRGSMTQTKCCRRHHDQMQDSSLQARVSCCFSDKLLTKKVVVDHLEKGSTLRIVAQRDDVRKSKYL